MSADGDKERLSLLISGSGNVAEDAAAPASSASSVDCEDIDAEYAADNNIARIMEESVKMNSFRRSRSHVDMVLICNEKQLSAHRLIVACCSPFFEELLLRDSKLQSFSTLEVEYVDEETMDYLLSFMYRGFINHPAQLDTDKLLHIIMAGQYLEICNAPAYFSELLLRRDDAKLIHACQLWEWADKLNIAHVANVVVNHIVNNFPEIVHNTYHTQLTHKCFESVLKVLSMKTDTTIDVETSFLAICTWIECDVGCRDQYFETLMSHLDVEKLSWQSLVNVLSNTSLLQLSTKVRDVISCIVSKSYSAEQRVQEEMEILNDLNGKEEEPEFVDADIGDMVAKQKDEPKVKYIRRRSPSICTHRREPLPRRSQSAIFSSNNTLPVAVNESSNLQQIIGHKNHPVLFLLSCSLDNRLIVHCCRLDNREWSAAHQLDIAAYKDMAIIYHESTLYLIGGEDAASRNKLSMVYAFDVETQTLRSGPHLRSPRSCIGVASHGHLLYLLGGKNRWNKALDLVEVFNPKEGWYMALPRMTERRYQLSCGVLQKRLYVIAGHTHKCEMLDLRHPSTTWDNIDPLPEGFATANTLAVTHHNVLTVVRKDQPMRVYCYNPIRNCWRTCKVEGESPGALVNIIARNPSQGGGFWCLDESGKIYTFDPKINRWHLEVSWPGDAKNPMYLAVEDFMAINKAVSS